VDQGRLAVLRAERMKQVNNLLNQINSLEDRLAALKNTVVATIGGTDYEGNPTTEINYLQRLRILVEKEAEALKYREALQRIRNFTQSAHQPGYADMALIYNITTEALK
jgi:hypothetical protein